MIPRKGKAVRPGGEGRDDLFDGGDGRSQKFVSIKGGNLAIGRGGSKVTVERVSTELKSN